MILRYTGDFDTVTNVVLLVLLGLLFGDAVV